MSNTNETAEEIAQEIAALERAGAAREKRAERDTLTPPSVGRLRAALAAAKAAASAMSQIEAGATTDLAAIDPQLQTAVGAARRAAVRAQRGKQARDALDTALGEIHAAREGSEVLVDVAAHRRRATFDPAPENDAVIRVGWIHRLARASYAVLEDFASVAVERRSVALASAIVEELDARPSTPASEPAARAMAARTRRLIETIPIPAVAEAQELLLALEVIERELRERARLISGGVPSVTSQIATGLLRQNVPGAA